MKVAFIIGNGFNYLIKSIIGNIPDSYLPRSLYSTKEDLSNRIGEISALWKKFDSILEKLQMDYPQVNHEELIRMIYAVLDFFSSIDAFKKVININELENIRSAFDFLLIGQIQAIAEEFRIHENSAGYKDLKRLFPDFGDSCKAIMTRNNVDACDFFTTNYDGILDTLLTKSDQRGFLAADGFGTDNELYGYFKLYEDNLKSKFRCLHIHGSYRFEKKFGNTYKNPKNNRNLYPVIIFNSPTQKEKLIGRDQVLSRYFLSLQNALEVADKLVIFGNSMQCEPHLKNLIKNKFNKNKLIYLCSRNPNEIKKELNGLYLNNNNIFERSTRDTKTIQDLLNFIEEIVTHQPTITP